MPPKEKKGASRSVSKKAKDRKEKKLLEEKINNAKQKCEEARSFLEPSGKHAEPNYTKAKEALEEAIAFYDADALPYFLMGECCQGQGEFLDAIDCYSKALDVNPRYTPALEGRALCYQSLDDIPHAVEDYTSMIEQDPENDHAYNMRGVCVASTRVPGLRLRMVDLKRCESDLQAAARLNEANYYALANLGKVYEDQGYLEKALSSYTASLEVKEKYTYARFRRGCAALRLAEKALVKDDDDEGEHSGKEGGGNPVDPARRPSHQAGAIVENIADIEREAQEKMREEEEHGKIRKTLMGAAADFTALLDNNPEADKNNADVSVVLNLGVCALLLGDLNKAEDEFSRADQIIAARPALVDAGEAAPIENVEQIKRVLDLRKAEVRKKKNELTETTA